MRFLLALFLTLSLLAGINSGLLAQDKAQISSKHLLKSMVTGVKGHDVLISEVHIPEGAVVTRHTHPTEEFFYVKSGTVILKYDDKPGIELKAGHAGAVPAQIVHSAWSKSGLATIVVFRVHPENQPDRTLAK